MRSIFKSVWDKLIWFVKLSRVPVEMIIKHDDVCSLRDFESINEDIVLTGDSSRHDRNTWIQSQCFPDTLIKEFQTAQICIQETSFTVSNDPINLLL